MYEGQTVGVVVPAYDEAGFVGDVIETVPEYVDRVYAVDDRSTDETWQEIQAAAERVNESATESRRKLLADGGVADRVVPIRHEANRGVGGAIKTGYQRALRDDVDVTAVMAGDGQMDPDQLERLLDPIVAGDADYTKGNRLMCPDYREGMPKFRLFGNLVLTRLTQLSSGYWNSGDPQNGYTAISLDALEALDVADLYDDYGFANEILARLNVHDMRVVDVSMPAQYGDEQSSIEYHTFIPKVSHLLLRNYLWRLSTKYLPRAGE